jgi:hypothetical protein
VSCPLRPRLALGSLSGSFRLPPGRAAPVSTSVRRESWLASEALPRATRNVVRGLKGNRLQHQHHGENTGRMTVNQPRQLELVVPGQDQPDWIRQLDIVNELQRGDNIRAILDDERVQMVGAPLVPGTVLRKCQHRATESFKSSFLRVI